jgi:hypothetical protein
MQVLQESSGWPTGGIVVQDSTQLYFGVGHGMSGEAIVAGSANSFNASAFTCSCRMPTEGS